MRLSKFISSSGYASRRKSDLLIENGFVIVNNEVCRDFSTQIKEGDEVIVENTKITLPGPKIFSFYKPKNCLCTSNDPSGRKTIYDTLDPKYKNLISIGRLDYKSEGLLLLTNNGETSRKLELPSTGWLRRYKVRVHGYVNSNELEKLKKGIKLSNFKTGTIEASLEIQKGSNALILIGRY